MIDSWCVYKHTSPSGKVYIGIAKDVKHRWRSKGNGYRGSTRFANAIKKYGVTSQAISHACTGKVSTCCGLLWKNL